MLNFLGSNNREYSCKRKEIDEANQGRRGFTLIETVVAIAILTITISGMMGAVYQSSGASRQAKDRTTAYYLAQEAVEYIRYSRDSAWKEGKTMTDWKQNTVDICRKSNNNVCQIDTTDIKDTGGALKQCDGGHQDCDRLRFNDALSDDRAWYEYDTGTISTYRRSVSLLFSDVSGINDGQVKVDVTVTYDDSTVTVTDYLYRWNEG